MNTSLEAGFGRLLEMAQQSTGDPDTPLPDELALMLHGAYLYGATCTLELLPQHSPAQLGSEIRGTFERLSRRCADGASR